MITEAQSTELIEVYRLGYSVGAAATRVGVSPATVRRLLRIKGELRPKKPKLTEEELKSKQAVRGKRYYLANKKKCAAYRKDYYETHKRDPGGQLERAKVKRSLTDPTLIHAKDLADKKYGLSVTEWNEMLIHQSGRCAICLLPMRSPHVDHNHQTGEVRGLLCNHCNRGLGAFYDSPHLLMLAAAYAQLHTIEKATSDLGEEAKPQASASESEAA